MNTLNAGKYSKCIMTIHESVGSKLCVRHQKTIKVDGYAQSVVAWRHLNLTLGLAPQYGLSR